MSLPAIVSTLVVTLGFVSCGAINKVGEGSVALVKKTTTATTTGIASLSDKIRPAGIKVVEVREQDLEKLPTGHDRAIAFQNTKKNSFWLFDGPVDFVEPQLPEPAPGDDQVEILLPPKDE
ncbi:hypothetical protein [Luteolibacter yonseiensis]|nr:hypothetical protein [Luteolibacter yonseiensis]